MRRDGQNPTREHYSALLSTTTVRDGAYMTMSKSLHSALSTPIPRQSLLVTPTHSLACSLAHSLTHSPTHSLPQSHTHTLTRSLAHSQTHSLTHPPTHSLTHPLTHLLTHSLTHSLAHSRTHSALSTPIPRQSALVTPPHCCFSDQPYLRPNDAWYGDSIAENTPTW